MVEDQWIAQEIAASNDADAAEVVAFLGAVRDVVDDLLTDGISVLAWPLLAGDANDPVLERIRFMTRDPAFELPLGFDAPPEELAERLRLPLALVERYPVVDVAGVLVRVGERLGLADDVLEARLPWFEAWGAQYVSERGALPYRPRPIGLEADFESWLSANISLLRDVGYDLRVAALPDDALSGHQHHLDRRHRPDLICRAVTTTGHASAGDWVVVELKATAVGQAAVHQLARYVDLLSTQVDEPVRGLLVTDGLTVNGRRAAAERDLDHLTASALGYRDVVRRRGGEPVEDPDETSVAQSLSTWEDGSSSS